MNYIKRKIKQTFFDCNIKYNNFEKNIINTQKPNILILCTFSIFGGIEMHCLAFYKKLKEEGYNAYILIPKDSALEKKLTEKQLSFYSYKQSKIFKPNRQPGLKKAVLGIIKKHNINIVHCNRAKDTHLLKGVCPKVKLILTRHAASLIYKKYIKKFDAIMAVNKSFIEKVQKKFPQKIIIKITPFFLENESLNFQSKRSKQKFFKKEFNINLENYPTIVQLGGLTNVKNHKILFYAANELINKKNKPVNVLLCGDGYNKKYLQKLAKKLNIQNYIYFLGFTNKKIEVIYNSDIKTLTSKTEGHPISLMEAGLLKKALIGPSKTGITNTIIHNKTGLIFENNNAQDLANQIKRLLDNKDLLSKYGQNAYKHIKNNFTSDILMSKIEKLHKKILEKKV
ncbi:glycosyltransferase [Candidatus Dependentiae bacterium]|nr:glycosyltransferase [Candidatus Dependentiae bacterium]